VLLVVLFVGFIRFRLLDMPLERDEGEYAYAGQLILQGIPPYKLAYNMKLPGAYFAYALGMAVFGQTIAGVHLTLIAANSLTIISIFLLGRKLFGTVAGLATCVTYAVVSISLAVAGLAAHATHFVVLCAVPATLLLVKASETGRCGTLFFSGLLYGLAFLMKQHGICFCLFAVTFMIWRAARNKFVLTNGFAKTVLALGAGMILPFFLFCALMALAGNFGRFWFWTFTYAGSYVGLESLTAGIQLLADYLKNTTGAVLGFWALLVAGLPVACQNKSLRETTVFVVLFWLFSFCGVAIGLYFRPHYFVLLLPAFAMAIGLAVQSLQSAWRSKAAKIMVAIFLIVAAGWNISAYRIFFFKLTSFQVSKVLYGGNLFAETLEVAKYLREHSAEDARIAVLGSEPEIYFYAHRHSATGYIYTYALMERQPHAAEMQRDMIREIETNKPEYIVLVAYRNSLGFTDSSDLTILNWQKKYSEQFYEIACIVNERAGETAYLSGEEARNYHGALAEYIVIYKRKPLA
jgi:4-amino-4-deoxy-L-arabinose transferase-like glycosyltransferase